ncbi:MAG: hypothetical protein KBD10_00555 [Candidatus Pacebacteria bacterium]|nr:hypothetical protein [Candidatus Paceibacterota bacterium]
MREFIILVGCVGCGKGTLSNLLKMAFPRLIPVSTSEILKGGRSDGQMIKDNQDVHNKLVDCLIKHGLYDYDKDLHMILDGAGRVPEQMPLLINFFQEEGLLTEGTRFVKLNVPTPIAKLRMQKRWLENAAAGTLRPDEKGSINEVNARIDGRLIEWLKARDGVSGKEGVYAIMDRMLRGHKSPIINIDATQSTAVMALDVVDKLGWKRSPMIDVLLREGLDMEGVSGHYGDGVSQGHLEFQGTQVAAQ